MTRVGDSPRHRDQSPSWRAIFRRPSKVEVNVFRRVSSTAQSTAGVEVDEDDDVSELIADVEASVTMQTEVVLLTQNTSRQHADTPRFGGRLENVKVAGITRWLTEEETG